jgi:hypothetical protein
MNQSKTGSYYDSTRNARPYTSSYGGSNQYAAEHNEYDDDYGYEQDDDNDEDNYENVDHVFASDNYHEENLDEEDDYYGRYTNGRETGNYNNYERFNEQRNNFGYGNYSGRGDYGYHDQHTLPRYNSGNNESLSYGRSYTGYSNNGQDNDYPSSVNSNRDYSFQSNDPGTSRRRRQRNYSF